MDDEHTGDGGGREFGRVLKTLRSRMLDETYPVNTFLPPQRELAEELDVSRDTVRRVVRELTSEGWISTRQGSGSKVIKTQRIESSAARAGRSPGRVALAPLISEAFERPEVTLDVFTLTSESLDAHIRLQSERIREKEIAPESIALRMLLPDPSLDLPYPRNRDDRDDPRLRERLRAITDSHTESLVRSLRDLRTEELVAEVQVDIRHTPLTPAFKLYLLNGVEALHGMYDIIERPIELDGGEVVTALDVLGLGATLTHHVAAPNASAASESVFVHSMQAWFDSVWRHLSHRPASGSIPATD
ncbi:winged helix-turn-helix domain-containing protein [Streptomyces sp. NPDC029526]|uniref:winged helix-turn-helix domain-containing protein n=1 Tax=Streptomyces sp. NPDC029526 TaxID=3155728 RepID=UPI0033CE46BD